MKNRFLPIFGIGSAFVVFLLAVPRYPGGYQWSSHSVSALFQPTALNGAENEARPLAILAMFLFCLTIGIVFKNLASRGKTKVQSKTIEIAGIGAMVYTFLVVTPMHNLLVGFALLFFVVAMTTTLYVVYQERRFVMFSAGIVCLSLTLTNAIMYYGDLLFGFLPAVQKISAVLWVGWLVALQFMESSSEITNVRSA